jgi:hypothetical protein
MFMSKLLVAVVAPDLRHSPVTIAKAAEEVNLLQ